MEKKVEEYSNHMKYSKSHSEYQYYLKMKEFYESVVEAQKNIMIQTGESTPQN